MHCRAVKADKTSHSGCRRARKVAGLARSQGSKRYFRCCLCAWRRKCRCEKSKSFWVQHARAMEILKPVDDTTKRPCLGRCSPKMSVSGPNASSRPSKAFHFGLLDVPHSELFPSANDTGIFSYIKVMACLRARILLLPGL